MNAPTICEHSAAAIIARFLKARGVDRVFGFVRRYITPIWMRIAGEGRPNMHGVMARLSVTGRRKTLLDPELIRCVAKSGARAPDRAESTSPKTKVPSQSSVKSQQKHAVSTQALA